MREPAKSCEWLYPGWKLDYAKTSFRIKEQIPNYDNRNLESSDTQNISLGRISPLMDSFICIQYLNIE